MTIGITILALSGLAACSHGRKETRAIASTTGSDVGNTSDHEAAWLLDYSGADTILDDAGLDTLIVSGPLSFDRVSHLRQVLADRSMDAADGTEAGKALQKRLWALEKHVAGWLQGVPHEELVRANRAFAAAVCAAFGRHEGSRPATSLCSEKIPANTDLDLQDIFVLRMKLANIVMDSKPGSEAERFELRRLRSLLRICEYRIEMDGLPLR